MSWMLVSLALLGPNGPHEQSNPFYAELIAQGIGPQDASHPELALKLPPPEFPDGLTAAEEERRIRKVLTFAKGSRYAEFMKPQGRVVLDTQGRPSKGWFVQDVNYYYVVQADLKVLQDRAFLNSMMSGDKAKGVELDAVDLANRNLKLLDPQRERYGAFEVEMPRDIQLFGAGRTMSSGSPTSALTAAAVLPRFVNDPDYPNYWVRNGRVPRGGKGMRGPFLAAAAYMKVTKLQSEPGFLIVEGHFSGLEPEGWYGAPPGSQQLFQDLDGRPRSRCAAEDRKSDEASPAARRGSPASSCEAARREAGEGRLKIAGLLVADSRFLKCLVVASCGPSWRFLFACSWRELLPHFDEIFARSSKCFFLVLCQVSVLG